MGIGDTHSKRLLGVLRRSGPSSPGELQSRLGVSQPTLFRASRSLSGQIIALGARRNRKLAVPKMVLEKGYAAPIFRISLDGVPQPVGQLLAMEPASFALVIEDAPSLPRYFSELPAFLNDVRPRGFFGAAFARHHPDLNLPPDPESWGPEHVLEALLRRGEDLPGNLLVGKESFERFQAKRLERDTPIPEKDAAGRYPGLAKAALAGQPAGSPVWGDSPKFGAVTLRGRGYTHQVIVKFSPPGDSAAAIRARDLLLCEWLALETLSACGIRTSRARILESHGQIFLELERFDRSGEGGRIRTMSCLSLGMPHLENPSWTSMGNLLAHEGKISPEDLHHLRTLEAFSRMIANSDRSVDNISFLWPPGEPHAALSPAYDVLPSFYGGSKDGVV